MSKSRNAWQPPPRRRAHHEPTLGRTLWEYAKSLGIAFILFFVIKTSIVEAYKIPSGSMEDTLLVGDFLLANKFLYGSQLPLLNVRLPEIRDPEPGDVVIFRFPKDPSVNYIKRCVAVGGQTVMIRNKVLTVDGEVVELPPTGKYVDGETGQGRVLTPRDNFGPYVVPEDCFFMMGDNRDNSYDSRFWYAVPKELIQGKAMMIHWSWGTDDRSPDWSWTDPISVANSFVYNAAHFVDRVRWDRLGSLIR